MGRGASDMQALCRIETRSILVAAVPLSLYCFTETINYPAAIEVITIDAAIKPDLDGETSNTFHSSYVSSWSPDEIGNICQHIRLVNSCKDIILSTCIIACLLSLESSRVSYGWGGT